MVLIPPAIIVTALTMRVPVICFDFDCNLCLTVTVIMTICKTIMTRIMTMSLAMTDCDYDYDTNWL